MVTPAESGHAQQVDTVVHDTNIRACIVLDFCDRGVVVVVQHTQDRQTVQSVQVWFYRVWHLLAQCFLNPFERINRCQRQATNDRTKQ